MRADKMAGASALNVLIILPTMTLALLDPRFRRGVPDGESPQVRRTTWPRVRTTRNARPWRLAPV